MNKYKILMENASLVSLSVCVACAHARVVVVVVRVLSVAMHGPFGLDASIRVQESTGFTQLENKNRHM